MGLGVHTSYCTSSCAWHWRRVSVVSLALHASLQQLPPLCCLRRWKQQQAALAACLRGGDVQSQAAAQGLREVYRAWDVEVETELKPFL